MRKYIFTLIAGFVLLMSISYKAYGAPAMLCDEIKYLPLRKDAPIEITISAAGDCTMGYDEEFGYLNSFADIIDRNGYEYPYKNVLELFKSDDITVVNLETTLTNAVRKAEKEFRFKGKPEYASILENSSIECVNIANNHTHDYLEQGYKDTIDNLEKSGTGAFNDYQPTPLEGEDAKRIIDRLKSYSSKMQYGYDFNAQKIDMVNKEDVKKYSF